MGLITLWALLIIVPIPFVAIVTGIEAWYYKHAITKTVRQTNIILSIVTGYMSAVLVADNHFNMQGKLFLLFLAASAVGVMFEYFASFIWYNLMQEPLYTYFKAPVYGFTSFYNFPFWGYGGLVCYSLWSALGLYFSLDALIIYAQSFLIWSNLILILVLSFIAIRRFFMGNVIISTGQTAEKVVILNAYLLGGIVGTIVTHGLFATIPYFVLFGLIGTILEGTLGMVLRIGFGEFHWKYWRSPIIQAQTSLLIISGWIAVGLIMIIMFGVVGL